MNWPFVLRSRLNVANRVIERPAATIRGQEELNTRLNADLSDAVGRLAEPQAPIQRVKPVAKLSRIPKNTGKHLRRAK